MMKSEFESLTGIFLTAAHYHAVEAAYAANHEYATKQEFCRAYKENRDGMAERIAYGATMTEIKQEREAVKKLSQAQLQIGELREKIECLEYELEREQEWKPHEIEQNVPRKDYEELAKCSNIMTDEGAAQLIADEFGFQPERIRIIRSVQVWEINRHNMLREVGEEERPPRYAATDWNYIRFDVNCWHYEMYNGNLRQYYC